MIDGDTGRAWNRVRDVTGRPETTPTDTGWEGPDDSGVETVCPDTPLHVQVVAPPGPGRPEEGLEEGPRLPRLAPDGPSTPTGGWDVGPSAPILPSAPETTDSPVRWTSFRDSQVTDRKSVGNDLVHPGSDHTILLSRPQPPEGPRPPCPIRPAQSVRVLRPVPLVHTFPGPRPSRPLPPQDLDLLSSVGTNTQ